MDTNILSAELRKVVGRKTDALRADGLVPAVVYGFDTEPISMTLDRNAVDKMYRTAGESTVIDLQVDGKSHNVLIQDIQRDALTDFIIHADFRAIDMTKPVEATVTIHVYGESVAVKGLGGTLIQSLEEVEVKALPKDLISSIEVDISVLATFEDVIRVKDISTPEGVEVLTSEDRTVATVQAPRTEEEMAALDEEIESKVEEVEVEGEKKEDGEGEEEVKEEAK